MCGGDRAGAVVRPARPGVGAGPRAEGAGQAAAREASARTCLAAAAAVRPRAGPSPPLAGWSSATACSCRPGTTARPQAARCSAPPREVGARRGSGGFRAPWLEAAARRRAGAVSGAGWPNRGSTCKSRPGARAAGTAASRAVLRAARSWLGWGRGGPRVQRRPAQGFDCRGRSPSQKMPLAGALSLPEAALGLRGTEPGDPRRSRSSRESLVYARGIPAEGPCGKTRSCVRGGGAVWPLRRE